MHTSRVQKKICFLISARLQPNAFPNIFHGAITKNDSYAQTVSTAKSRPAEESRKKCSPQAGNIYERGALRDYEKFFIMQNRCRKIHSHKTPESTFPSREGFVNRANVDLCYISRVCSHTRAYLAFLLLCTESWPNAKFTMTLWNVRATDVRQQFPRLSGDVRALGIFYRRHSHSSLRPPLRMRGSFHSCPLCVCDPSLPTLIIPHYSVLKGIRSCAERSLLPPFFQSDYVGTWRRE